MKFLFPENYNFKSKLLGFIDYPTAIFNIVYLIITSLFFNLLIKNLTLKLSFIVLFYTPIFLFSIVGFNNENLLFVFIYMIKFFINPKIYIYK